MLCCTSIRPKNAALGVLHKADEISEKRCNRDAHGIKSLLNHHSSALAPKMNRGRGGGVIFTSQ